MPLIRVSDVLASMGIAAGFEAQVSESVTSGIGRAISALSAHLGGVKFNAGTSIDKFYPDSSQFLDCENPPGGLTLNLTQLYVSSVTEVSINTLLFGGEEVVLDPSEYKVVAEKGQIIIPAVYDMHYVTVTYESGFTDEEDVDARGDLFKTAVIGMTPKYIINAQPTSEGEGNTAKTATTARGDATTIVTPLVRIGGIVHRPYETNFAPAP